MMLWPFIVLQIVIFVGLVILLRRILSQNMLSAASHLQGLSAEYTRRHEELKRQVKEAERQYQEQLEKARIESAEMMTQAKQEAESTKMRTLSEARSESEQIIKQAMESSSGLKSEFEERVNRRAIQRAAELVQQVLPGALRKEMQSQWLDDLLKDGLSQVKQLALQEDIQEVRVASAFGLSEPQRRVLSSHLKEYLGREISIVEKVDERLVAGLIISVGNLVLDGSLQSKIRGAVRDAQSRA